MRSVQFVQRNKYEPRSLGAGWGFKGKWVSVTTMSKHKHDITWSTYCSKIMESGPHICTPHTLWLLLRTYYVFWGVKPGLLVSIYQIFEGFYCSYVQGQTVMRQTYYDSSRNFDEYLPKDRLLCQKSFDCPYSYYDNLISYFRPVYEVRHKNYVIWVEHVIFSAFSLQPLWNQSLD